MGKRLYTLTPLTGVHIGTGEELSPLDYKIASKIENVNFNKPVYWKFSNDRILQRLCENENERAMSAFERVSVDGNMRELYNFFQNNCVYLKDTDYPCEITKKFKKLYYENQEKDPQQNAAKVLQMYHTEGTPNPVIPGSSLKGSIRTALLNRYLKELSGQNYFQEKKRAIKDDSFPGKYETGMQKKLLDYKDGKDDPLRAVSLSDCAFKATGTQLVGGLDIVFFNRHTGSLEPIDTQIQAEVLRGELLEGKAVSEFCITINEILQKTPFPLKWEEPQKCIKKITFDDIHKSCNDFYWDEFKNEYDKFYKDISDGSEKQIKELKRKLEAAVNTSGQFIIRVGRWSQVEFVTFEDDFRKPLTKKNKFGKPLDYGTTRTLFDYDDKYVPMGWCILKEKEKAL
jgi:CRISPR-associated protein Csm5